MKIQVIALAVILCAGSIPLCGITYEKEKKKPPRVNINDPAGPPKSGASYCESDSSEDVLEVVGEIRGIGSDRKTMQVQGRDREVTLTLTERTVLLPEGISLNDFGVGNEVAACYRAMSTARIALKIYKVGSD